MRGVLNPEVFALEHNGRNSAGGHQNLENAAEVITAISPFAGGVTSLGVQSADGFVQSPYPETISDEVIASLVSHRYQPPTKERGTSLYVETPLASYTNPEVPPPWTRGKAYMGWRDLAPLSFLQLESVVGKRLARWYLERDSKPLSSDYRRHIYTKHTAEAVMHGYPVKGNEVPLQRFYGTLLANGYLAVPKIRREQAKQRSREIMQLVAAAAENNLGWDELTMETMRAILPAEIQLETFSLVAMFGRTPEYSGVANPHEILDVFLEDPHQGLQKYNDALQSGQGTQYRASLNELPFFSVYYDPELNCFVRRSFGLVPKDGGVAVVVNGVELGGLAAPVDRDHLFDLLESKLGNTYIVPKAAALLVSLNQGFNMHREGAYEYEGVSRNLAEGFGMEFAPLVKVESNLWEALEQTGQTFTFRKLVDILLPQLCEYVEALVKVVHDSSSESQLKSYLEQMGFGQASAASIAASIFAGNIKWMELIGHGSLEEGTREFCEQFGLPIHVYRQAIDQVLPEIDYNLKQLADTIYNPSAGAQEAYKLLSLLREQKIQNLLKDTLEEGKLTELHEILQEMRQLDAEYSTNEVIRENLSNNIEQLALSREKLRQTLQVFLMLSRVLPADLALVEGEHLPPERKSNGVAQLVGAQLSEPEKIVGDYNLEGLALDMIPTGMSLKNVIALASKFEVISPEKVEEVSLQSKLLELTELCVEVEKINNQQNQGVADEWLEKNQERLSEAQEFVKNVLYLIGKGSAQEMTEDLGQKVVIHGGNLELPKLMLSYPRQIRKLLQTMNLIWNPVTSRLERMDLNPSSTMAEAFPNLIQSELEWMQIAPGIDLTVPEKKLLASYRGRSNLWEAMGVYDSERQEKIALLRSGVVNTSAMLPDGKLLLNVDVGEKEVSIVTTAEVKIGSRLVVALPGSVILDDKGRVVNVDKSYFDESGQRLKAGAVNANAIVSEGCLVSEGQIGGDSHEVAMLDVEVLPGTPVIDLIPETAFFYDSVLPASEQFAQLSLEQFLEMAEANKLPLPFLELMAEYMAEADLTTKPGWLENLKKEMKANNKGAIQKIQTKLASDLKLKLRKAGDGEDALNVAKLLMLQQEMIFSAVKSITQLIQNSNLTEESTWGELVELMTQQKEEATVRDAGVAGLEEAYAIRTKSFTERTAHLAEVGAALVMQNVCTLLQYKNTIAAAQSPQALSVYALGGHELFRELISGRAISLAGEA